MNKPDLFKEVLQFQKYPSEFVVHEIVDETKPKILIIEMWSERYEKMPPARLKALMVEIAEGCKATLPGIKVVVLPPGISAKVVQ